MKTLRQLNQKLNSSNKKARVIALKVFVPSIIVFAILFVTSIGLHLNGIAENVNMAYATNITAVLSIFSFSYLLVEYVNDNDARKGVK